MKTKYIAVDYNNNHYLTSHLHYKAFIVSRATPSVIYYDAKTGEIVLKAAQLPNGEFLIERMNNNE